MIHNTRTGDPQIPDPGRTVTKIGSFYVEWSGVEPTAQEVLTYTTPTILRPLLNIIADLNALSAAKKTAIWNDLNSGTPPKWALDNGPNAAAIAVLQLVGTLTGLNAADILTAKIRGVAMFVSDNPAYLVNPPFDATINIPGRQ